MKYRYEMSIRNTRGKVVNIESSARYDTYDECDKACCSRASDYEERGCEFLGGDVLEVEE